MEKVIVGLEGGVVFRGMKYPVLNFKIGSFIRRKGK